MKKFILFFFSLSTTLYLFAQPVITGLEFGEAGDSYIMKGVEPSGFDAGAAGEDVVWDFSGLTLNGGTDVRNVIDAAGSLYYAVFPDANIATVSNDTSFAYYNVTSSLFSLYGTATPTIIQAYDDPADLANFPVNYNDTKSDVFTGSTELYGYSVDLSGTSEMTADGYGTIILPGGASHGNVMRIKIILDIDGVVDGLPITAAISSTIYYYLIPGVTGPAFQYSIVNTSIAGVPSASVAYADANEYLFTDIPSVNVQDINVFPNPASDNVFVNTQANALIALYTMQGEKVMEQIASEGNTLDVSKLPAGNYLLTSSIDESVSSQVLVIQH